MATDSPTEVVDTDVFDDDNDDEEEEEEDDATDNFGEDPFLPRSPQPWSALADEGDGLTLVPSDSIWYDAATTSPLSVSPVGRRKTKLSPQVSEHRMIDLCLHSFVTLFCVPKRREM